MTKVELEEMKKMSLKELEDQVDLWRTEYTNITFNANLQKKAEKPHMFNLLRKQIARAKTVVKLKQMQGTE